MSQQPGYDPHYGSHYGPPVEHPEGTTVLVLGILGLVLCGILGIPAWVKGNRVLREIDESGQYVVNRGNVAAGRICGIVGTALLTRRLPRDATQYGIEGDS